MPVWLLLVFNYVERIFWTFVQAWIAFALTQSTLGIDTAKAASVAGLVAVLNVILALATDWAIPTDLPFGVLAMARVLRTWLVSVIGILLATPDLANISSWKLAAIASFPAVLAAVKQLAAERLGAKTPAILPASADLLAQNDSLALGA